jgi:hypothetical protein
MGGEDTLYAILSTSYRKVCYSAKTNNDLQNISRKLDMRRLDSTPSIQATTCMKWVYIRSHFYPTYHGTKLSHWDVLSVPRINILTRIGPRYDVNSDWYLIYSLLKLYPQRITIAGNTLALAVPWILLVNSFFVLSLSTHCVHSMEMTDWWLRIWLTD